MTTIELNMDGLVGPTHHYAGLSKGNKASTENALKIANPKAAALQGLSKMRLMHQLGLQQAFLPPHPRPNLKLLHQLGFKGTPAQQIESAYKKAPKLLSAAFSASSMWTANTATVTPSHDSLDKRVHFTAANLISNVHRSQEAVLSHHLLQTLFHNDHYFKHHAPLPAASQLSDEGAANHCRLSKSHQSVGIHLFVYGKKAFDSTFPCPKHYPARQTLEAAEATARLHALDENRVIFAQQNPLAIDRGVFHHDVIGLSNEYLMIIHEQAFLTQTAVKIQLKNTLPELQLIEVPSTQFSLDEAVQSYFFNSQLITLPDETMTLIAPSECMDNPRVMSFIESLKTFTPIKTVHYLNLNQSMLNGGGPACLRLRVPLSQQELGAMHQEVLISPQRLEALEAWVNHYYRDQLSFNDLRDPLLIDESFSAIEALSKLIRLDLL